MAENAPTFPCSLRRRAINWAQSQKRFQRAHKIDIHSHVLVFIHFHIQVHIPDYNCCYPFVQKLYGITHYPNSRTELLLLAKGGRWPSSWPQVFKKKGTCDVAEIHWGVWMLGLLRTDYKLQLILLCVFSRGCKKTLNGFQEIIFITKW